MIIFNVMAKPKEKDINKAVEKADQLGRKATEKDLKKIEKKLPFMRRGPVAKIWEKVQFLWNCLQNSQIPKDYLVKVIGALLYLVLPFDVVPDTIPVVGLMDDAAVITLVYDLLKKTVTAIYKQYEQKAFSEIDKALQKSFLKMVRNYIITMLITAAYILIKVLHPFGNYSSLAAIIVLAGNGIWFTVRTIIYLVKYGKYILPATKQVFIDKSIKTGILNYARKNNKLVNTAYTALKISSAIIPDVPEPQEIVDLLINQYKKRVILMIVFAVSLSTLFFTAKLIINM